jgi:DNA (cytosine-5)-methyltransferase 1
MSKLRVLDLFSGIGGFSLGLERTGGFETVAFCEIEEFPRRVLAKHWPNTPCYRDVRELTAERLTTDGIAVDVICGGFPCQDISLAGTGAGLGGARSGLWSEFARLIREIGPRFVLLENVAALLGRGLAQVLRDLAAVGYDAEWHCIRAAAVGAHHERDRVWLVAHPRQTGLEAARPILAAIGDSQFPFAEWRDIEALGLRAGNGIPNRVDRVGALGNAVVPQIPELIGRAILASLSEQREAA